MPFLGFIVNRVHPDPAQLGGGAGSEGRPRLVDPELKQRLLQVYRDQQTLARVDQRTIARLEVDTGERPLVVPELEKDVHDLRGLHEVGEILFGGTALAGRVRRRVPKRG